MLLRQVLVRLVATGTLLKETLEPPLGGCLLGGRSQSLAVIQQIVHLMHLIKRL